MRLMRNVRYQVGSEYPVMKEGVSEDEYIALVQQPGVRVLSVAPYYDGVVREKRKEYAY